MRHEITSANTYLRGGCFEDLIQLLLDVYLLILLEGCLRALSGSSSCDASPAGASGGIQRLPLFELPWFSWRLYHEGFLLALIGSLLIQEHYFRNRQLERYPIHFLILDLSAAQTWPDVVGESSIPG